MTDFDAHFNYLWDIDPKKKAVDTRAKYFRNAGSKNIHKSDCEQLSSTGRNQWMWATGKTAQAVVSECKVNTFGLKPCRFCFKKELREPND